MGPLLTIKTAPGGATSRDHSHALLVDEKEALDAGFVYAWEVAEHFGIPPDVVRVQARLLRGDCA